MELELTAPLAFVQQGRLECLTTPSLTITGLNKAREGGREASRRRDQCHRSPRAISFQIALSNCRGSFFFSFSSELYRMDPPQNFNVYFTLCDPLRQRIDRKERMRKKEKRRRSEYRVKEKRVYCLRASSSSKE